MANFESINFAQYAIEVDMDVDGCVKFKVFGYDEYPESSIFRGQQRVVFLESFPSLAEAKRAYPEALCEHLSYFEPAFPSTAPEDFSELDAGEVWDEQ